MTAVFLAIRPARQPQVWISKARTWREYSPGVAFLRDVNPGTADSSIGKRVAVIGGGNVAIDVGPDRQAARRRKGDHRLPSDPRRDARLRRRDRGGRRRRHRDLRLLRAQRASSATTAGCRASSVKQCTWRARRERPRNPPVDEGPKQFLEADTVIVAIGQGSELGLSPSRKGSPSLLGAGIARPIRHPARPRCRGLCRRRRASPAPGSVVEAVAGGKEAAESIDRYLNGEDLRGQGRAKSGRPKTPRHPQTNPGRQRDAMRTVPPEHRRHRLRRGHPRVSPRRRPDRKPTAASTAASAPSATSAWRPVWPRRVDHSQEPEDRDYRGGLRHPVPGLRRLRPSRHWRDLPLPDATRTWSPAWSSSGSSERLGAHPRAPACGPPTTRSPRKSPGSSAWAPGTSTSAATATAPRCAACTPSRRRSSPRSMPTTTWTPPSSTWTCAPSARTSKNTTTARQGPGRRALRPLPHPHHRSEMPEPAICSLRIRGRRAAARQEEIFDLVVLSVGMQAPPAPRIWPERLGVALNPSGFAETDPFTAGGHLPARRLRLRDLPGAQGHPRLGHRGQRRGRAAGARPGRGRGTETRTQ